MFLIMGQVDQHNTNKLSKLAENDIHWKTQLGDSLENILHNTWLDIIFISSIYFICK